MGRIPRHHPAMRVLVAFDKFKDALTAGHACEVACSVLQSQWRGCQVDSAPLTDGGEGFCEILTTIANGRFKEFEVGGPRGECTKVRLGFAQADRLSQRVLETGDLPASGEIAVIEMAAAAGLHLLAQEDRDPWETSTHGVGEMILRTVEEGVDAILLGIGGSDAHLTSHIATCMTDFKAPIRKETDLVEALLSKEFQPVWLKDVLTGDAST